MDDKYWRLEAGLADLAKLGGYESRAAMFENKGRMLTPAERQRVICIVQAQVAMLKAAIKERGKWVRQNHHLSLVK